jgi:restriction endonuclease Mrr
VTVTINESALKHKDITAKAIGKTNDEGIDGTIKEDKLGLDVI